MSPSFFSKVENPEEKGKKNIGLRFVLISCHEPYHKILSRPLTAGCMDKRRVIMIRYDLGFVRGDRKKERSNIVSYRISADWAE